MAFHKVAAMYIKYTLVLRKLEECYDQIVHPQKRRLIRHMLDGTIGRLATSSVCAWMGSLSVRGGVNMNWVIICSISFTLRVLEMKHELYKMEILEYSYFDDLLTDMKLTPVNLMLHWGPC